MTAKHIAAELNIAFVLVPNSEMLRTIKSPLRLAVNQIRAVRFVFCLHFRTDCVQFRTVKSIRTEDKGPFQNFWFAQTFK